jgi:hypothetical protein
MDADNETSMATSTAELSTTATANYSYDYVGSNGTVTMLCEPFNTTKDVYSIFSLVVPNNRTNWVQRTDAYWAFFYIMLVVFGLLYLCLALGCILLLAKRHLAQRFRVRTFIAIDVALMVLGFSRVLFLIVDPWGQSGFCNHYACIVISRLIGALSFPSLTASYTLVLITLWSSARMQLGRSWIQRLKVLIPLCFVHYGVAIVFEILGSIPTGNSMIVIILLIVCESTFSIWGFLVCFSFLITGHRLLKSVERSVRSSSIMCKDSPNLTRHQLIEKSKFQNQNGKKRSQSTLKLKHMLREKHRRAIRKVSLITYITVLLGMTYSMVNFVNLILLCLSLFYGCPGYLNYDAQQHPAVWLTLRYISFVLELLLAVLLTYSISDYQPILNLLCCGMRKVGSRQPSPTSGLESTTIDSECTSRHIPSRGSSPVPPRVDSKDDELIVSNSSNLQIKSPTLATSPPSTGTPKKVTIFEYNTRPTMAGRTSVSTTNLISQPKVKSPLTVSYSLNESSTFSTEHAMY